MISRGKIVVLRHHSHQTFYTFHFKLFIPKLLYPFSATLIPKIFPSLFSTQATQNIIAAT